MKRALILAIILLCLSIVLPAQSSTGGGSTSIAPGSSVGVTNLPTTVTTNAGAADASTIRVTQANGQSTPATGNITSTNAACVATACVQLALFGTSGTAVITVTGTSVATIQFEATANDAAATYQNIQCNPVPTGLPMSSLTTAGATTTQFICETSGFSVIRARASAYTSGTATVTINQAIPPNPSTSPAITQNVVADFSSTAQINAGATFVTACHSTLNVQGIQINLQSDQNLTYELDQFPDASCATTGQATPVFTVSTPIKTNQFSAYTFQATNSFYQFRITNTSGSNTTTFRVDIALCPIAVPGSVAGGTFGDSVTGAPPALGRRVVVGFVNGANNVSDVFLAQDTVDGLTTAQNFFGTMAANMVFNGTTLDRQRSAPGTVGIAAVNTEGTKATYRAAASFSPTATAATDIFTITGSGTKTVRVTHLGIACTATAAIAADVIFLKRSSADTSGTSSAPALVPLDSTDAAATATVLSYTANPTTGTLVGNISADKASITATTGAPQFYFEDFTIRNAKGLVLRGTGQVLAINLNAASIAGIACDTEVEWTEE